MKDSQCLSQDNVDITTNMMVHLFNPSGGEAIKSWENLANIIVADALLTL